MKQRSLLLLFHLITVTVIAQRPDSVQVNGQWYFVYPLQEKVEPTNAILDKLDLSEAQFKLFKEWKLSNDPRLKLSKHTMIDSLNRELIRIKITVSKEQNRYEWRNATEAPKVSWPMLLMRKKHWYRKYPELMLVQDIDQNRDLVPAVQNLPNGKYIQYFEPVLSYHGWKKSSELPTRVAAIFELKNNLPENEFTRFNYKGDTVRHGYFTDGLKERQWTVSDRGSRFHTGIHGLRENRTFYNYNSSIRVNLEKGILEGTFYKWISGSYQPVGYFKNGYADSIWKTDPYYAWRTNEIIDYNSILDSNYNQPLSLAILPSVSLYKRYDGFDFKEKKNRYLTISYFNLQEDRYEQGVPALPLSGFEDLFSMPMRTGLNGLRTVNETDGYNRNTGQVNFHGTKQIFEGTRLTERYTYLPGLGTIVYARFFKNGALFDTLGYEPQNKLFVHNIYDVNGKLFQTTTYNTSGGQVQQINYFKQKEKKVRYKKPVVIDGFETEYVYYFGTKLREWEGSRVVDGKQYTRIRWTKTKRRRSETYKDLSDSLEHQVTFNRKGEIALDEASLQIGIDSSRGYNKGIYATRNTVPYKEMKLIEENENVTDSPIVLTCADQPYSGRMSINFSKNRLKLDDQPADGLNWTIPSDESSRSLRKQFMGLYTPDDYYPMSMSERPYYLRDKDFETPFSHVMDRLFHDQFNLYLVDRMEGEFQNGQPSGNWNYYNKKGELVFTLNFVNGLPNGDVIVFGEYVGPNKYDRKYHQDEPYYTFLFSKDAPKNYRRETYHFTDGKLDGPKVTYTAMGDTLEIEVYKAGQLHGKTWRREDDDVFLEEYQNGKLHGLVLEGRLEYNERDEVVMDTLSFAHYKNDLLHGDCYFEFYENNYDREDYGDERRGWGYNRSYKQALKTVKCQFHEGLPHGNYVQRLESGETEFAVSLAKGKVDTLTFFENGAPSYYYDYVEQERLQPYSFSDSARLGFKTRFFRDENLESKFSNGLIVEYGNNADELNIYGGYRNPTIEDYKQGRFTKLYPNGNIARRGYRIGDKNWGDWDFYNYNGQRLYSIDYGTMTIVMHGITYTESEIKGVYIEYDSLGEQICRGALIEELEKYDCAHSDYYAIRQFIIIEDRQDEYERTNGPMKYYFDNGMLMSEGTLKNGMPDGVWMFYTPDGKLTRIGKYVNGKKEGRWLKGDLGDKKYIGEICLNPDDPLLDFHIAELERLRDVEIVIYKNGTAQIEQQYEVTD
ncbi:MAG: hypothetical protein A3D31_18450 [Candidatus Fluviicola riflensis]|nr:MAG: hypothetical protein CHH17_03710 [Candidatus Fluviicola riflensis]OGS76430.1 MAG: hypothetical protein A3D31_18450 [Candidatus Fluviicola riflensis]OGS82724.1 MAG: hypothetical protein A2724_13275 [Fluviicola sp. RIFCSPHIGHO2_01_FULL_43_53]OGS89023.1 MAG: hypothetical protein A3E30_16935 [Fluviicola sp. RIFCSPHIGHO2_12_FULL_43_24]